MMDKPVVLVTGAQRGIGRAIAVKAAAQGYAVAANYFEEAEDAAALVAELQGMGAPAMAVQGDMSQVASINAMVAEVDGAWGRIDALVNNAGIFPRAPLLELDEATWDAVLDVNLKGTCFATIAAATVMIRGGRGGAVITMASSAVAGGLRSSHYNASKGGIVSLTRGMALELAPYQIRVNSVAPGLTNTRQPRDGLTEEEIAATAAANPLGRMAEPQDIADVVLYLMSPAAAMVNAQVLHVNGGVYRP